MRAGLPRPGLAPGHARRLTTGTASSTGTSPRPPLRPGGATAFSDTNEGSLKPCWMAGIDVTESAARLQRPGEPSFGLAVIALLSGGAGLGAARPLQDEPFSLVGVCAESRPWGACRDQPPAEERTPDSHACHSISRLPGAAGATHGGPDEFRCYFKSRCTMPATCRWRSALQRPWGERTSSRLGASQRQAGRSP